MTAATRIPEHAIEPLFYERWSPRAFTAEAVPEKVLLGLIEAARWAPSSMNLQPWRFVYARRGTPAFERFLSTLAPGNQLWAARAAALVAVVSHELSIAPAGGGDAPARSRSHAFDAGAAWAHLALQAHLWGWGTHAMGGFDPVAARDVLRVPEGWRVEVFVAIGRPGDPATLPDWARAREKPSGRKPLAEILREGTFE